MPRYGRLAGSEDPISACISERYCCSLETRPIIVSWAYAARSLWFHLLRIACTPRRAAGLRVSGLTTRGTYFFGSAGLHLSAKGVAF